MRYKNKGLDSACAMQKNYDNKTYIVCNYYTFPLTATLNVQRSVVGYGSASVNIIFPSPLKEVIVRCSINLLLAYFVFGLILVPWTVLVGSTAE